MNDSKNKLMVVRIYRGYLRKTKNTNKCFDLSLISVQMFFYDIYL